MDQSKPSATLTVLFFGSWKRSGSCLAKDAMATAPTRLPIPRRSPSSTITGPLCRWETVRSSRASSETSGSRVKASAIRTFRMPYCLSGLVHYCAVDVEKKIHLSLVGSTTTVSLSSCTVTRGDRLASIRFDYRQPILS